MVQYNLVIGLAQHGIVPHATNTYSNDQIFEALRALYGIEPIVDCVYDSVSNCWLAYTGLSQSLTVSTTR